MSRTTAHRRVRFHPPGKKPNLPAHGRKTSIVRAHRRCDAGWDGRIMSAAAKVRSALTVDLLHVRSLADANDLFIGDAPPSHAEQWAAEEQEAIEREAEWAVQRWEIECLHLD